MVNRRTLLASLLLLAFHCRGAAAAEYDVDNDDGSGTGSLAAAVAASNGTVSSNGSNTVDWQNGSGGPIPLSSVLGIDGNTTLEATNAGSPVSINGSAISLNGAVTFDNSAATAPFTVNSVVEGSGSFTKSGTGVVVLTGANTYTGGTVLDAGVLQVNSDSALGNASGGLTFNGGTLQAGAALSSARSITLNGSGTFDANGFSSTLSGVISGSGELIVTDSAGGGVLSLTNTGNTYSGGTLLEAGTLSIGNQAVLGSGGLAFNGGTLELNTSMTESQDMVLDSGGGSFNTAGATSTLSGLISGAGALIKISSGTLTLTGANTYTGGTVIAGGVLAVYNEGNLGDTSGSITLDGGTLQTLGALDDYRGVILGSAGGTIDTDGNDDYFYGSFSGSGLLTKSGDGTLALGGVNTYTGGTTLNEGTLLMEAADVMPSAGVLTVANGATFDANGFSQDMGSVVNDGLLRMETGALTLNGAYQGSGTLAVTIQPDVTNVTATGMTLSGGTLDLLGVDDPAVKTGTTFTVLSATTLSGEFSSIESPAAVAFAPTYTSDSLVLTATLIPFASLGATPNQIAEGEALEGLRADPTGDNASVLTSLYSLDLSQIRAAFDQVGPTALASLSSLGLAASSVQAEALGRRMTALDSGEDLPGFTVSSAQSASPDPDGFLPEEGDANGNGAGRSMDLDTGSPWSFFASGVGTYGRLGALSEGGGSQPAYDYGSGGLVLGGDREIGDSVAAGLTAGYQYGQAAVATTDPSTVINNSARGGVYGTGHFGNFRADLYAGGALDYFSISRGIEFGATEATADSSPSGRELNANGSFSYDIGTEHWGTFSPFLGVNEDRLTVGSFSESGAGALDLNVAAQTAESLRSTLGLRQSAQSMVEGVRLQSHWSLGWLHEFDDQSRAIDAEFASGAGSPFSVNTADLPRDGLLAGAGVVVNADQRTSLNLDASADVRERFVEYVGGASVRLRF